MHIYSDVIVLFDITALIFLDNHSADPGQHYWCFEAYNSAHW